MALLGSSASSENVAIATGYGIHDRDFRKKLGAKVPKHKALSIFRELEGKMEKMAKTSRHEYYFYEEGDHLNTACTIAVVGSPLDASVTLTLSAADHFDIGSGTNNGSYPVVGQLVVFENETVGYVSAKGGSDNAHTVTIKQLNTSQLVGGASVVGGSISFGGNAQKEGSTATQGRVPNVTKITNYITTARENYSVTDFAAQNEVEFEYKGQKFLYPKGIDDTVDRFSAQEEFNLIIAPASSGLTDASSNAIQTAGGLIPQIADNGLSKEYLGAPDMSTFDDIVLALDNNYGDDEYLVGCGINLSLGLKNWLNDFADSSASFKFFDGGKEQALKFDFKGIMIGGVDFYFQTWNGLSHKGSLGAGDMPYRHMGIMIPCGSTKDPNTNEQVPYMRLRYAEPQGAAHEVQRDIKVWETGANAKKGATSDELVRDIHMVSYKGLEIRNREKFMLLRKA
jgi:hypothetical protein